MEEEQTTPRVVQPEGASDEEAVGGPNVQTQEEPRAITFAGINPETGKRQYKINPSVLMHMELNEDESFPREDHDQLLGCFQVLFSQQQQMIAMLQGLLGLATGNAKPQLITNPNELASIRDAIRRG